MSLLDSEHVRIIEVDEDQNTNNSNADLNRIRPIEGEKQNLMGKKEQRIAKKKANGYKGLFFAMSLLIGVGIARLTDTKELVMFGLAFGFLFFIDPFYEKVMKKIENW